MFVNQYASRLECYLIMHNNIYIAYRAFFSNSGSIGRFSYSPENFERQ